MYLNENGELAPPDILWQQQKEDSIVTAEGMLYTTAVIGVRSIGHINTNLALTWSLAHTALKNDRKNIRKSLTNNDSGGLPMGYCDFFY